MLPALSTRRFSLPTFSPSHSFRQEVIDPDSIEAQMRDGVLYVTLQKTPAAQPKKVAIKAG